MSDVVFRRIRGRIVPIKKKKDSLEASPEKGAIKVASGGLLGVLGAKSATKDLKKSFKLFRRSAIFQGAASRQPLKSKKYEMIKDAAKLKIKGRRLRNISKGKFGIAIGLSSALIGSGVSDFFRKDSDISDEIGNTVGAAAGAAIVTASARKFGLKAASVTDLFTGFASRGQRLSRQKIRQIRKAKLIEYK